MPVYQSQSRKRGRSRPRLKLRIVWFRPMWPTRDSSNVSRIERIQESSRRKLGGLGSRLLMLIGSWYYVPARVYQVGSCLSCSSVRAWAISLTTSVLVSGNGEHERHASQPTREAEAKTLRDREIRRRSSHQSRPTTRTDRPDLHRRSTVKVNGPRSPMPKSPRDGQGHYTTPIRSPVPMRSPQTPGLPWSTANEPTPRAPAVGMGMGTIKLAPPVADVLKWAAEVPLPLTPATPAGFPTGTGTTGHAYVHSQQPQTVRTAPVSPRTRAPGVNGHKTPGKGSAAVDQEFLDNMVQRLSGLDSELESPPFSRLSSSTVRNLDRLGGSAAGAGTKGSPTTNTGRPGKMQNVFRMMKDKENQPNSQGGQDPALRRKRSVFDNSNKENRQSTHAPSTIGGEEYGKEKGKEKEKENRKSVYAPGAFTTPLDTKFGQNLPGGMKDANRKGQRRESSPHPCAGDES
jgi:hypothetical protein